jgi:hypothetical protein
MTLRTKHTPMPLQLLGAALLTTLAFGAVPVAGALDGDDRYVPLAEQAGAVAEVAEVPEAPAARVWMPAVPELPDMPELPELPALAEVLPEAPELPELPALASRSVPDKVEEASSATALASAMGEPQLARPRGPTPTTNDLTSSSKKKKKRARCEATPNPAIESHGDRSFTVQRDLVQTYARSIKKLNSLGWSTPHEGPDGKNDGMLVGGVRCGSDLHLAGVRSGDVVHTVNGKPVKSFPQALVVYHKVRNDDVIEVQLTRRGKPTTLTYRLQG